MNPLATLLIPVLAMAGIQQVAAQTIRYSANGFESPTFTPGNLATDNFFTGQDGWLATADLSGTIDYSQIRVQTQTVWAGSQAVTIDAAGHSLAFMHLRRNTQFEPLSNPAEPVLDIRMRIKLDSSANPSDAWGFQAQAGPGPGSGLFQWDIHPSGEVHYVDPVTGAEVGTGYLLAKNVWHDLITSLDYTNQMVTIYVDGLAVATFQGNPAMGFNFFGFASIALFDPGDDRLHMDDFEIQSRAAGPMQTTIGSSYCGPAIPNSSGLSAQIEALGSTIASQNDVLLRARNLPPSQFGIFLVSDAQGFTATPGLSQGNLCLSGAVGRYNLPGQVLFSAATGSVQLQLDLSNTPTPTGPTQVIAGQTMHFQLWTRDFVGGASTSNFTNGLTLLFQ